VLPAGCPILAAFFAARVGALSPTTRWWGRVALVPYHHRVMVPQSQPELVEGFACVLCTL